MKDASKHPLLDMFPELLNGVEYKPLGKVCLMERGTSATKGTMQSGEIPVISGGRQPAFYCNQSNRTGETITIAGSGAGAGYVQYWNEPIFVCDAFSIKGNDGLMTKYTYYYLSSIQEQIYSTKKGGGVPHVHISSIDKFEIPLPPLPVQEAIVNILDRFAVYAAELQAELQARQQQYNYYRDTLLSFEGREDVQWKKLGEVCDIRRGIRVVKKQLNDNGVYPVFQNSIPPMGYYDQCNREGNLPYVICAGSSSGSIGYCSSPFWAADDCYTVEGIKVNNRYAFHTLKKNNHKLFSQVRNGSMPRLPHDAIDNLIIPIPSLEEQERISTILDRFDTLTNDLSQGLPAEIEARQQQYEYYRDQLLTFKRKEA